MHAVVRASYISPLSNCISPFHTSFNLAISCLTYLPLLSMQPLITLRRGRRADPKCAWALGYALTLEDIPRYGEMYKCHFDCPNIDGPFFKVFNRWTDMALWMGRDLTRVCGGKQVEVLGCLPRRPTRRQQPAEIVDGSEVPPIPLLPAASTSESASSETTSSEPETPDCSTTDDAQKMPENFRDSPFITVVAVAQIEADTLLEAERLLLRLCRDANKPYPLQRYWKTIEDRLHLPEESRRPCLYEIWQ